MDTDSRGTGQPDETGQNDGTPAARGKSGGKKSAPPARQKARTDRTASAALAEERRKNAEAQAALKDLHSKLAAVEEALAEEKRKSAEAQRASASQRHAAEQHHEESERSSFPAGDFAFGMMPLVGFRGEDLLKAGRQLMEQAVKQPPLALKHYTNFMLEMGRVMTGKSTVEPSAKDRRFADEMWKTNPFYHALMQTYLTWQQSMNAFIDDADLGKKDADRARFVLSLYMDAVAPTNTLLGNPAAMKKMYETGGASLVRGLTHMLEDLANNGGLPSQVNMKAFQVGKDLANTSGAVVFKNEVLELIQYQPTTPLVYSRPLLTVPPQVNKFYVMDLSANKSMIRYLVANGFQVFAISWRNPTVEHRDWGFETYDLAIMEAIDAVRAITGSEDVNISGACLGGMTLATLLGHLAAREDRSINAVTFLVTVLDSNIESTMGLFASKETIAAAKQASRLKGVIEGQEMARAFAWLRPNDLIWNYWVNNYLIGNEPAAFDVLYWNNDSTRLPARIHGELLDLFETNAFAHPGSFKVLDTPIDLTRVKQDSYIVAGITDHITPWQGCYATTHLLGGKTGGKVKFILSNSGHIQALLNPPGNPKASYFVNDRYPADPEKWLAGSRKQAGSWWEDWAQWIGQRAGEQKPAPQSLGNEHYPPGTAAPGTYVFEP